MFCPLLLALVLLVSLHDLRRGRIPNWVTLPLLGIGLLWNFPGALETWLACLLLFAAWRAGWLGGGDAKLWMALLWLAPGALAQAVTTNASPVLVMSGIFVLTALVQLLWRKSQKMPLTGHKSPGAWRTIPYAIWLCTLPISGWLF
jgi:Flp pilus assembly protein protease CpaA